MVDRQAAGLRRDAPRRAASSDEPAWPQVPALAITGGKGGVGKTSVAVNLAVAMARNPSATRVLLVDFDLGLANADLLLGVTPTATLADVLAGRAKVADAVVHSAHGVDLLPAASGFDELTRLGDDKLRHVLLAIARLAQRYDRCLIDTAAGIGSEVLAVLRAATRTLCVVTPDPTSLTDAYALLKLVEANAPGRDIRLCVNCASDLGEATVTANRMRAVVSKYLGRDLPMAGWIPRDGEAAAAVRRRQPFAAILPACPAAAAVATLAHRLASERW